MTLAELRAYILAHFADNGTGDIDAAEMRTALLTLCERIEAEGSWQPILTLAVNGPFIVLKVADWTGGQGVKPTVNVYAGATGYVTDINQAVNIRGPQGPQGLPSNGAVGAITQPGDGFNSVRYYPVCELPAPTGGTYDFVDVELVGKSWDASQSSGPTTVRLMVTNRGGTMYKWGCVGPVSAAYGLCVYAQSDGRVIIYAVSDNAFRALHWRVVNNFQAVIYSTNNPAAPSGNQIMNTCLFNIYPPTSIIDSKYTTFTSNNADGAQPGIFPNIPGFSSLSLGANLTGGSSELDFVNNSGYGSGGFAFWQQTSPTARRFLAYLTGTGSLGIGTSTPTEKLHIEGNAYVNGVLKLSQDLLAKKIVLYDANGNDHQFYGYGIAGNTLRYQVPTSADSHVWYSGVSPISSKEIMRLTGTGLLGLGAGVVPTSLMHLRGSNGYTQLQLEASYTPANANDANGALGQVCWDANYVYVKVSTNPHAWRRSSITGGW